jgi:Leucine-rich repeat (LRR) protein
LHQLRNLNLCNNPIHDVSPLLELDTLENLDITGNSNLVRQIRLLEERGVVVNVD